MVWMASGQAKEGTGLELMLGVRDVLVDSAACVDEGVVVVVGDVDDDLVGVADVDAVMLAVVVDDLVRLDVALGDRLMDRVTDADDDDDDDLDGVRVVEVVSDTLDDADTVDDGVGLEVDVSLLVRELVRVLETDGDRDDDPLTDCVADPDDEHEYPVRRYVTTSSGLVLPLPPLSATRTPACPGSHDSISTVLDCADHPGTAIISISTGDRSAVC